MAWIRVSAQGRWPHQGSQQTEKNQDYFSLLPSNSIWREDSKQMTWNSGRKPPTTQNRYYTKTKTVYVATRFNIATKSWVEFLHFFFFSNTLLSQSRNNYLVWKSLDTSYHETNLIKVILCERENKLSWTEHQKNLTYKWEMLLSVHKTVTQYIKFEPSGQTRKSSSRPNLL